MVLRPRDIIEEGDYPTFQTVPDWELTDEDGVPAPDEVALEMADDALFDAYEKSVWWALDEEQESLTLQKAPAIWESLGELGTYIRDVLAEVIQRPDVVWSSYSTADEQDASATIRDVLEDHMGRAEGWTLGGIAQDLQDRLDLSQSEALDIARNETASVLNVARVEAQEEYARETEQDEDEFLYDWVGPTDHRTTDLCRAVEREVDSRGGAVPLTELKGILMEQAKKYADDGGTPERVDEFHPHYNCRRTFTRRVQSL